MASLIAQLGIGLLMGGAFTVGAIGAQTAVEETKKAVAYVIDKTTPPQKAGPITRDPELDRLYAMQRYNNLREIMKK